jgi:hypothetical protein
MRNVELHLRLAENGAGLIGMDKSAKEFLELEPAAAPRN